jgi:hypothetical protein
VRPGWLYRAVDVAIDWLIIVGLTVAALAIGACIVSFFTEGR